MKNTACGPGRGDTCVQHAFASAVSGVNAQCKVDSTCGGGDNGCIKTPVCKPTGTNPQSGIPMTTCTKADGTTVQAGQKLGPATKLGLGDGDCDKDADCKSGLKCGTDNCGAFRRPAGWLKSSAAGFDSTDDCCYAPQKPLPVAGNPYAKCATQYVGVPKVTTSCGSACWSKSTCNADGTVTKFSGACSKKCYRGKVCPGSAGNTGSCKSLGCVFPFKYKGVTYTGCTKVGTSNPSYSWCSQDAVYGSRYARCGSCESVSKAMYYSAKLGKCFTAATCKTATASFRRCLQTTCATCRAGKYSAGYGSCLDCAAGTYIGENGGGEEKKLARPSPRPCQPRALKSELSDLPV